MMARDGWRSRAETKLAPIAYIYLSVLQPKNNRRAAGFAAPRGGNLSQP